MQNVRKVRKVLILILFANLAVAFAKLIMGHWINSNSLVADGYHSFSDGFSNIAGLVGLYLATRPVDEDHPYGHKKFENMTGLFIGVILFFFSFKIAWQAIENIQNPVVPTVSIESFLVLISTLVINIFVATYEYRKGQELQSDILLADSLHTKSDIFVSCGVLLTLAALYFGAPPVIDSLISLVIVCFICFAAFEIVKKTSWDLLDSVAVDVGALKEITLSFPEVIDVHAIRSRKSGDDIYVDMHIWVDPAMSICAVHTLGHEIEEKLKEKIQPNMQVLIHAEPFGVKD